MSGVCERGRVGRGGVPSWVGPMPPEVTTRSYRATILRLASTLGDSAARWDGREGDVHFMLVVGDDLDALAGRGSGAARARVGVRTDLCRARSRSGQSSWSCGRGSCR